MVVYESETSDESIYQSIEIYEKTAPKRFICRVVYRYSRFKRDQTLERQFSIDGICEITLDEGEFDVKILSVEANGEIDCEQYIAYIIEDLYRELIEEINTFKTKSD